MHTRTMVDAKALARQVLRHIREPDALRANPLTQRFFRAALNVESSLVTIRAVVIEALPHGSRARRVVEECDFNGRSHKAVARELVLSERQFYRERALAFELIARALEHGAGTTESAAAGLVMRIESLHDLLFDGHATAARRAAEQALTQGVPTWAASRLLAAKASACEREGDRTEAADAVRRAAELASGELERADVLGARASGAFVFGELDAAKTLVEEAVRVTRTEALLSDPAGLRAHVRYAFMLANLHAETSDAAAALRLLDSAHGLILSRAPNQLALLGAIKVETACVALCLPEQGARSVEELSDAQAVAYRTGSSGLQARVETLSGLAKMGTAPAEAQAHARLAVELAAPALAGEALARALLSCARVLTVVGDAAAAIGVIELARAHCVSGGYLEAISAFRLADALSVVGRHADAARLAECACSRIAAMNRSHHLGSAHLAAATANAALGRSASALDHVHAAMPLLEHSGFVFELRRANQIAARISGDPRYGKRAEELAELIRAS